MFKKKKKKKKKDWRFNSVCLSVALFLVSLAGEIQMYVNVEFLKS